ncbi:MAG: prepilin-type N-terminal cleavage/methylation domain-containing protein [Phycisphaerae bacterium]|nr:prepilin-type N-terminal cleavage/methylation domain-containing protein [Phycisphaerae bacterium]
MWSTGRHRRKKAFTLIELIVVIVLVAVLAGMVAPRLRGAGRGASLRAAAWRVFVAAQYAHDFAATRRRVCRLELDPDTGRFQLIAQADPEHRPDEYKPLEGGPGRAEQLEAPLRFALVRAESSQPGENGETNGNRVTFYPSGRSDAAIVQITDGRRTYSVLVFPSRGRCRLVEERIEQLPNDQLDLDA